MIDSVSISRFRGVRAGSVERLTPLTVLTGRNGNAKSAVLDALLVACAPDHADAVGRAVRRHPATSNGARWLFHGGRGGERAFLTVTSGEVQQTCFLELNERPFGDWVARMANQGHPSPYSEVWWGTGAPDQPLVWSRTGFAADNSYWKNHELDGPADATRLVRFTRLVDPGIPHPLENSYSEAFQQGRDTAVEEMLGEMLEGFQSLRPLKDGDRWDLFLRMSGVAVPVGLAGDGVQALVQLALDVAGASDGLVLVEEPEVYLHRRALAHSARALLGAVRRGLQVVVTTHSLEFIDALLLEASDNERNELLSLQILALRDGELSTTRWAPGEVERARNVAELDLR